MKYNDKNCSNDNNVKMLTILLNITLIGRLLSRKKILFFILITM